jgi:hypothetical protein
VKLYLILPILLIALHSPNFRTGESDHAQTLTVQHDENAATISVFRGETLMLVQNVKSDIRPYIHPIIAPDGLGVLTEFSPSHHKHQTGLYWGLKKVNGRDYFMNWKGDYWRKVSARVIADQGPTVKWQTVYELLDEKGSAILMETQIWSMEQREGKFLLDFEWRGEAKTEVRMEKFYVGGLFLRMPWREGIAGEVINADGKKNGEAEGQRAKWNDIGIQIDGRKDKAHIAILDHPKNADSPVAWRVDNELGIGPSRQILGDWSIQKGKSEIIRYRLVVYAGEFRKGDINQLWKQFAGN